MKIYNETCGTLLASIEVEGHVAVSPEKARELLLRLNELAEICAFRVVLGNGFTYTTGAFAPSGDAEAITTRCRRIDGRRPTCTLLTPNRSNTNGSSFASN